MQFLLLSVDRNCVCVCECVLIMYAACFRLFRFFSSYPALFPLPFPLLMCGFLRQLVDSHTYRVAASRRVV